VKALAPAALWLNSSSNISLWQVKHDKAFLLSMANFQVWDSNASSVPERIWHIYQAVKARFWPWPQGKSPSNVFLTVSYRFLWQVKHDKALLLSMANFKVSDSNASSAPE